MEIKDLDYRDGGSICVEYAVSDKFRGFVSELNFMLENVCKLVSKANGSGVSMLVKGYDESVNPDNGRGMLKLCYTMLLNAPNRVDIVLRKLIDCYERSVFGFSTNSQFLSSENMPGVCQFVVVMWEGIDDDLDLGIEDWDFPGAEERKNSKDYMSFLNNAINTLASEIK